MGKQRHNMKHPAEVSEPVNATNWEARAVELYRAGLISLACLTSNPDPKGHVRYSTSTPKTKSLNTPKRK